MVSVGMRLADDSAATHRDLEEVLHLFNLFILHVHDFLHRADLVRDVVWLLCGRFCFVSLLDESQREEEINHAPSASGLITSKASGSLIES